MQRVEVERQNVHSWDVQAEGERVFDDLDVTAQAGGVYRALIKTVAVNVSDGTLDLKFVVVNKAALVSAIAVVQQTGAPSSTKEIAGGKPGLPKRHGSEGNRIVRLRRVES